jgi:hypothetical protein
VKYAAHFTGERGLMADKKAERGRDGKNAEKLK